MNRLIAYDAAVPVPGQPYALLTSSLGESLFTGNVPDILGALLTVTDYSIPPSAILRIAWNVDEFAAPLLRLLDKDTRRKLVNGPQKVQVKGYTLFYMPGKMFSVKGAGNESTIYGLADFFPENSPAPEDVNETWHRADNLLKCLEPFGVLSPTKLTSPISVFANSVLSQKPEIIPTIADLPDSALGCAEYALECTNRPWVSNYQVGHWERCLDYDLTAAFPSEAAKLLDTRYADISYSKTLPENADWGFLRGEITINPQSPLAFTSPIVGRIADRLVNATGSWPDFLTLDQVNFIKRWKLGEFEARDGWFLRFYERHYPIRDLLTDLYQRRSGGILADRFAKKAANGLVGKMIEVHRSGQYGDYYNPMWHAIATNRVSLKVGELLYNNSIQPDELISVDIDGCKVTKELDTGADGQGMGHWRLSGTGPVIALAPGAVLLGGRKPNGINYHQLTKLIQEHPASSYYATKIARRVTIPNKETKELGEDQEYEASIDLNAMELAQNRVFDKFPRTGRALLNGQYRSRPIEVDR